MKFKIASKNLIKDKARRPDVIAERNLIKNKAKKLDEIAGKNLDIFVKDLGAASNSMEIIKSIRAFRDYTKSRIIIVEKCKAPINSKTRVLMISNQNNWALVSPLFAFS